MSEGAPAGEGTSLPGPPAQYANQTNPHSGDSSAAKEGEQIFQTNCASCHGEKGRGDGPAAVALNPKPADLAANMKSFSDGYLIWRISEDGQMAPFNSAMPFWKGVLSEDEIWRVITYLPTSGN